MGFAKDFVWGAAAASYQIEGAAFEDGKGLSIWDVFCQKPGAIRDGHTGDVACDHYHRYKEDVAIMKELGLQAYRMSISWPRVIPAGTGTVNNKGLDFYDRLVDELLSKGIEPYITLFHWDFPFELYKKGGWMNPESSDWFAEYVRVVVDRLSDRVSNWITLNEPQCFIYLGHESGEHAPGVKMGIRELLQAGHNALLAHGKAVQVIRQYGKKKCEVGFAPVGSIKAPASSSQRDVEAARKATFSMSRNDYVWVTTWFSDPVYLGTYPEDGLKAFEKEMPSIGQDDMKIISQPLDFCGVNFYHCPLVSCGSNGEPVVVERDPGYPRTSYDWPVSPEGLYWGPKFLYERYGKPVLVTENGMANPDWVAIDGRVHDYQRIDFLQRYLREYKRAAEDGIPLKGYFCWSVMDNFEWAEGYNQRFGLVHVDYKTQKRTIKDSGYWYRTVIESNGENL